MTSQLGRSAATSRSSWHPATSIRRTSRFRQSRSATGSESSRARRRCASRRRLGGDRRRARRRGALVGCDGLCDRRGGERAGEAVDVPGEAGGFIVVGEVREDLRICSQTRTLLTPRVLDPKSMTFRGATMQRLPADERDDAEPIVASARGGALDAPSRVSCWRLVRARHRCALGDDDGDPATAWSEGRPGDGHGEFVTMRAPAEVPIARLAITPAPTTLTRTVPHRARSSGNRQAYDRGHASEDAWMHPGASYDIPLVEPIRASCISLVLDRSYMRPASRTRGDDRRAHGVLELDHPGATLREVADALAGGGARATLRRVCSSGLATQASLRRVRRTARSTRWTRARNRHGDWRGNVRASAPLLLAAVGIQIRRSRGRAARSWNAAASE